jgi:hypothetical protein
MSCITMLACQYCKPVKRPERSVVPGFWNWNWEVALPCTTKPLPVEVHITPPFSAGAQYPPPPFVAFSLF